MKILISHFGIYKKGGWGRTFSLAKELAKTGNNVTVITSSSGKGFFWKKEVIDNIVVYSFQDIIPLKILTMGFGFFSFINRLIFSSFFICDIVHVDSHRPNAYYVGLINKVFHKSKLFIEWWDYFGWEGQLKNKNKWFKFFLGRWEEYAEINSKKKADGVIVLSHSMYNRALKAGIQQYKLCVIHGGSGVRQLNFYSFGLNKEKIGLTKKTLTFGFIGGGDSELSDMKPFFDALQKIYTQNNNIKFLNFGNSFSKAVENHIIDKNMIIEMGWIDYSKDTSILSTVDIFVLIKRNDIINIYGWPTKFGDYLALGRPIMVNLYGDLIEVCNKYNINIISVEYDVNSIYAAISDVVMGKYNLNEMGQQNRIIAEKYMSWGMKVLELERFYKGTM